MSKRLRWGLYIVFLVGFLVSAPLVVLYTAGYRFHLDTGRVTRTGLISVSSVPRGAAIFLDGKATGQNTPAVLKNIVSGAHTIRLEKAGYFAWEKRLTVESELTTFATNVPLFVEKPALVVQEGTTTEVTQDPTGRRVAFVSTEEGFAEVWMLETDTATLTLLTRYPATEQTTIALAWSVQGSYVSVQRGEGALSQISLFDVTNGNQTLVSDHLENVTETWWDPGRDNRFFVRTNDSGFAFDIPSETVTSLAADAMSATSNGDDLVTAQTVGSQTVVSRARGSTSTILAYIPNGTYAFRAAPNGLLLLEDAAHSHLVLLDASGTDQPILLNADANAWRWEPTGRRLLYSDGFDIHIYDPDQQTDDTLTRLSTPLTGLAWYPPGGAVLYAQAGGLYALEMDARSGRQTFTLQEGTGMSEAMPDPRGRAIFFIATIDDVAGVYRRGLQR